MPGSPENARTAREFITALEDKYSEGGVVFRGAEQVFEGDQVSSSLYREWAGKEGVFNKYHQPPDIEKEIVEKAKTHFPDNASNIEILTEIRHYGGKVNLIDFTRSLYVALFFACQRAPKKDGQVAVLHERQMKLLSEIKYDESKNKIQGGAVYWLEPAKTQMSKARIIAQHSVFVYTLEGVVNEVNFEVVDVPSNLKKKGILECLRRLHGIHSDTIYNDLFGFIDNETRYETAPVHFYRGNAKAASGDEEGAIECYNQAIGLVPHNAPAYINRGNAESRLGRNEEAIKDFDRAIEVNPKSVVAYRARALVKEKLGDTAGAEKDRAMAESLEKEKHSKE